MNNAIMDYVREERKKSEKLSDTLMRLLKSPAKNRLFLEGIIRNPRHNKSAYRQIINSFTNKQKRQDWLDLYEKRYCDFMNELFKKANSVEDVLRVIPNLSPWTLEQRFGCIKIGCVPEAFKSEENFLILVAKLHRSAAVKAFKRIKKLECHLPAFQKAFPSVRKIDWFDFSARSGFLRKLMKEQCGKPFSVKQDNQVYQVTFLCNPYSNKMVFQIMTPMHSSYILKLAPYQFLNVPNDRVRKEHENMAIRPDSTFSDALLEFYLKLNQCPNAPNILYYHFNHEVALYQAETGSFSRVSGYIKKYPDFCSFNTKVVPDVARLGVYINDINPGNFVLSKKENVVKIIDIGHATFANPLTPGVPGMTFMLGNLSGRDYISINGVLSVEDV